MMRILAIQNCEIEGFGRYEKYFIDHGMNYQIVHWAEEYAQELVEIGKSKEQVVMECFKQEREMSMLAIRLLDNFFRLMVGLD